MPESFPDGLPIQQVIGRLFRTTSHFGCGKLFAMTNNAETLLDARLTRNVGLYYCCYRLSLLGWNVMPTVLETRGVDIVAYRNDTSGFVGVQVKAQSNRAPILLGSRLDSNMGDFWVVVNRLASATPTAFVMLSSEVRERARCGQRAGRTSYSLQPADYELETFKERWDRIVSGPNPSRSNVRRR